jgi:hypothetical protein
MRKRLTIVIPLLLLLPVAIAVRIPGNTWGFVRAQDLAKTGYPIKERTSRDILHLYYHDEEDFSRSPTLLFYRIETCRPG